MTDIVIRNDTPFSDATIAAALGFAINHRIDSVDVTVSRSRNRIAYGFTRFEGKMKIAVPFERDQYPYVWATRLDHAVAGPLEAIVYIAAHEMYHWTVDMGGSKETERRADNAGMRAVRAWRQRLYRRKPMGG
jgi:hypothetical protein